MVDCLEDSRDMVDHEKCGNLNVLDMFEDDLEEIQTKVTKIEPVVEPVDPENRNRIGTEPKQGKNRITKPVHQNTKTS